jgi:hypothetical protein
MEANDSGSVGVIILEESLIIYNVRRKFGILWERCKNAVFEISPVPLSLPIEMYILQLIYEQCGTRT